MSPRAHFVRPVTDYDGVPLRTCTVSVYVAGTRQLIPDQLYQGPAGSVLLPNPFTITTGVAEFFLDRPQTVSIGLESVDSRSVIDYLGVQPPIESVVTAENGLTITNEPDEGQFLQADSQDTARWVNADEISATKATPLQVLADYAYNPITGNSGLSVLDDNGNAVVPTYVTAPSGVPDGFHVDQAIRPPGNGAISFRTGPVTFPEPGWVEFCYYVAGTDPATAVGLQVVVDTNQPSVRMPQTVDLLNGWRLGYLGGIDTGTHTIRLAQLPGSDSSSYLLLGEVRVYYGTNIPPHTHAGIGENSLVLGPGASASFKDATAVGGSAVVIDDSGTAIGAHATAQREGTAIGAYAGAGSSGTAIGHGASNTLGSEGGLAVGRGARTQAINAIAIGRESLASGSFAIAMGSASVASNYQSIALGAGAEADAANSAAIGADSYVAPSHENSVALGAGAQTTARDQFMLGTEDTEVVVPGDLHQYGSTMLGGVGSTLGFFGASGTPKPIVTGSRGGNATLASVLSALAAMGLIDNQTGQ